MPDDRKELALYCRISRDDGSDGESESVKNQRNLLHRYLAEHPELSGYQVVEYVDDGYSGTTFDRPGIAELLDAVKRGEITCILVKDFSRFGRNYIEAGNYLEQVFPLLGVRFISVNDRYDSAGSCPASGGLEMAFQGLVSDFYSRDLSQKVKTARAQKMRSGSFTSPSALFGYVKSGEDKNRLEVDPPAAEIVRHIFELACDGMGTGSIARRLNDEGLPTPQRYKLRESVPAKENDWTRDAVTRILRDERYTGVMVCGKRVRQLGAKATQKLPRQAWVQVPGTHEAIIQRERFEEAQACMLPLREAGKHHALDRPLSGKLSCGYCGKTLRRRAGAAPYFRCETGRYRDTSRCDGTRLSESTLLETLAKLLTVYATLTAAPEKRRAVRDQLIRQEKADAERALRRCRKNAAGNPAAKAALYEAYRGGRLTQEAYLRQREQKNARQAALREQEAQLLQTVAALEDTARTDEKEALEIPPAWLRELVAQVDVFDGNRAACTVSFPAPWI